MSRTRLRKALVVLIPAAVILTPATTAFAKAHHSFSSGATCSAGPVAVGSTWTVNGANLPASAMVQFLVTDSSGAESSTTAMTDATGAASVSGHAWVAGTDNVTITTATSPWSTMATCSFQVG